MLAHLYMNRFLKYWRVTGRSEAFQARVVNYADDFVILSRGHAAEALEWTRNVMTRIGLTLNEAKTKLREARTERFDFLGYTFGPHRYRKGCIAIAKMVTGICVRVRRRRACCGLSRKWEISCCRATSGTGKRFAIASIRL
jgi:hypothetical protein